MSRRIRGKLSHRFHTQLRKVLPTWCPEICRLATSSKNRNNGEMEFVERTESILACSISLFLSLYPSLPGDTQPRHGTAKKKSVTTCSKFKSLFHASFRPYLASRPLRFAITSPSSGCEEDLHLQAVDHSRHINKKARCPGPAASFSNFLSEPSVSYWLRRVLLFWLFLSFP
jgi:hypothetical protein